MHRIFRVKAYEMEHGPHFNEEHARKAVMKMENEDGTRGQHWSLEETSALMLEDRIIVQDRGIDAGLAALMQNANKGSMDPAALLAMMNNNGMGGNGGWWWIWIILLFFFSIFRSVCV